jgi:hypothetical protein
LYPYYISSKLAGQKVTLSIQAKEQSRSIVALCHSKAYISERCPIRSILNSCSARPLLNNAYLLWGGGKAAPTDRHLHTMSGNCLPYEVGSPQLLMIRESSTGGK